MISGHGFESFILPNLFDFFFRMFSARYERNRLWGLEARLLVVN
jgi:hypothetical protein